MKHLKLFNDTASYEAWQNSEGYILPNVSYVIENNSVSYEPAIMNYPDIILQEGNTYPEVGARLSQMFNKYMTKYNRTIIQSPYDEPNRTQQFDIYLDYEYNGEILNLIGFTKLDPDGNPTPDLSIDIYDSLVEDDDYKYLKSLKCLTRYGDIIDAGLEVYFYPSFCVLTGCEIGFDGTLTFPPQPA